MPTLKTNVVPSTIFVFNSVFILLFLGSFKCRTSGGSRMWYFCTGGRKDLTAAPPMRLKQTNSVAELYPARHAVWLFGNFCDLLCICTDSGYVYLCALGPEKNGGESGDGSLLWARLPPQGQGAITYTSYRVTLPPIPLDDTANACGDCLLRLEKLSGTLVYHKHTQTQRVRALYLSGLLSNVLQCAPRVSSEG